MGVCTSIASGLNSLVPVATAGTMYYRGMSAESAAQYLSQNPTGEVVASLNPSSMGSFIPENPSDFIADQYSAHYSFGVYYDPPIPGVVNSNVTPGLYFSKDPGLAQNYAGSDGAVISITQEEASAQGLSIGSDFANMTQGGKDGIYLYSPPGQQISSINVGLEQGVVPGASNVGTTAETAAGAVEGVGGAAADAGDMALEGVSSVFSKVTGLIPDSLATGAAGLASVLGTAAELSAFPLTLLSTEQTLNGSEVTGLNGNTVLPLDGGYVSSIPKPPAQGYNSDESFYTNVTPNGWAATNQQTGVAYGYALTNDGTGRAVQFTATPIGNPDSGVFNVVFGDGKVAITNDIGTIIPTASVIPATFVGPTLPDVNTTINYQTVASNSTAGDAGATP